MNNLVLFLASKSQYLVAISIEKTLTIIIIIIILAIPLIPII